MNKSPLDLHAAASEFADFDFEFMPDSIYSVFGQSIKLISPKGAWEDEIRFEHIGYTQRFIPWRGRISKSDYIEWVIRVWVVDRIETSTEVSPVRELMGVVRDLKSKSKDAEGAAQDMISYFSEILPRLVHENREVAITGVRSFCRWAIDYGLPGFDEQAGEDILWGGPTRFTKGSPLVALRDPSQGPYTAVEMRLLNQALRENDDVSVRQRALFLLARDWGIRPIQLALLRVEDLGEDEIGPFIMVPSVKGIKRSKLRRASSNMVRRHIADDTAEAVKLQISAAKQQCACVYARVEKIMEELGRSERPPLALFPCQERQEERVRVFCNDPAIFEYVLHTDSVCTSRELSSLTDILAIPMSRSDPRQSAKEYISVTVYRLRRTKGTSLVLAGHLADEIAEALDHVNKNSITHYFRYSRDFHRFINETAAGSPEIVSAALRWEGRLSNQNSSENKSAVKIGSLGLCTLGSPCPHHPAVTCYACHSFRPDPDADHEAALRSIQAHQLQLKTTSTGPLRNQMEAEVSGAMALIQTIIEWKGAQ